MTSTSTRRERRGRLLTMALAAAFAVAGLAAPAAAPAASPDSGPMTPELAAAIERFDQAQAKTERISAHFREVKTIALLKAPIVQSGEFYHTKPDKFLWEYTAPEPKLLMLNGRDIVAYYPKQKRAEEIRTRFTQRIVKYLGLGAVLKDLGEEYEIALGSRNDVAGTDLLVLRPRSRQVAKRLTQINIWVDREMGQPRRIEYLEADGDRTAIDFDRIRINPEIAQSRYELRIPDDVTVTNGLSDFFGTGGGTSGR